MTPTIAGRSVRAVSRAAPPLLATVAFGSFLAVVAVGTQRGGPGIFVAGTLALLWAIAGLVGSVAGAPRAGALLMTSVGTLHLAAFALAGWLAQVGTRGGTSWSGAVLAQVLFGAGFVALALLLATYPSGSTQGRGPRLLFAAGALLLLSQVLQQALFSAGAGSVLEDGRPIPVPWSPWGTLPEPLMPGALALIASGVVLLVRSRGSLDGDRRARSWALLVGLLLLIMMVASPAGTALLGAAAWSVAFLVVAGSAPFLLLAGLLSWRLGSVDRYAVRLLSGGLLVVVVLSGYAVAATSTGRAWPLAAGATLVAGLVGAPALRRVERWADRWFTGGRLRAAEELRGLAVALATLDPEEVGRHATDVVRASTGATWCRLVVHGLTEQASGEPGSAPCLDLPLLVTGVEVGRLECGARPGGWHRADLSALTGVCSHVALVLAERRTRAELASRVEELAASRRRIVVAQEQGRRRMERDLHDGLQQQLVALLAGLETARHVAHDPVLLRQVLASAHDLAGESLKDLRALCAGVRPALLADRGLVATVRDRAAHLPIEVVVDADPRLEGRRFAPEVESTAYFVVAEALTNVMKHSGALRARVVLTPLDGGAVRVAVSDEGTGAARASGRGLSGLRDRVDALGGEFQVSAVPGVGTTVVADLVPSRDGARS